MSQSFGGVVAVGGPLIGFPGKWSRTADTIIVARPVSPTTTNPLSFGAGAVLIANATGGYWQSLADYLATATNAANLQQNFAGVATWNFKVTGPYSSYSQAEGTTTTTTTSGSTAVGTSVVVTSATGLTVGQSVEGYGVAANTLVTAISGTTITLSLSTLVVIPTATNISFTTNTGGAPLSASYVQGTEGEVLVRSSIMVQVNGTTPPQAGGAVYIRTVANASLPGTSVGDFEAAADLATSSLTIGTTIGSTTLTTSASTGIVVGQMVTGPGIPPNTYIVSGSSTTWVMSNAALATISSGGASAFYNTALLGTVVEPWLKFRTGVQDANGVAEILIANRHAA